METTSKSGDRVVVGREQDASNILTIVFDSSVKCDISVLPIVGMGGLGKTTLARLIFKHPKTVKDFDKRIWICVSKSFATKTIFKNILKSLDANDDQQGDLEIITGRLVKLLCHKRYLLVLDDLWHDKKHDWDEFIDVLSAVSSSKGNFIIITTRLQSVALMVNPQPVYSLDKLSNDECWSVIARKAFPTEEVPGRFKNIGYEIACKCGGLPLAANVIGASLQGKEIGDWRSLLESELSDSSPHVMHLLKVSYDRLPYLLLKKCFAYCAIFFKDARFIEKEQLIQLWMAEGFLLKNDKNDMESLGSTVYDTLLENSFLQDAVRDEYGNIMHAKMHDLVHDLAISISKEECVNGKNYNTGRHASSRVRYLAVKSLGEESRKIMEVNGNYLRTLFLQGSQLADDLFKDLKRLHVLNLSGSALQELSSSVGKLKHLRLLDVSDTRLSSLPDSIRKLYNLQTLNIHDCKDLRSFPDKAYYLLNMRHLVFGEYDWIETPTNIGNLTCLRTLPVFRVGLEKEGHGIKELGPLKSLRGKLVIRKLENVKGKEEAMRSDLIGKPNIQQLCLVWAGSREGNNNDEEVLEGLEPHPNIKCLEIKYFDGDRFPAWAMNMMVNDKTSLANLVRVKLWDCLRCEDIPTMGHLPLLKVLELQGLENVKSIGPSFYCENWSSISTSSLQPSVIPFLSLEKFTIEGMPALVDWVAPVELSATATSKVIGFPVLKELLIWDAPNLNAIPSHDLGSLERLHLWWVDDRLVVNMARNNNVISLRKLEFKDCNIAAGCSLGKLIQANQHHLEELTIQNCAQLSNLEFRVEEEEKSGLSSLHSLKELSISECRGLESIGFTTGECRRLPSLEQLIVDNCPDLAIVALEIPEHSRQRIRHCPRWKEDIDVGYTVRKQSVSLSVLLNQSSCLKKKLNHSSHVSAPSSASGKKVKFA